MTRGERSGVIVVDKPAGVTSFDMVALLRRRLGVRRIGHGGTLDPAALGVLPMLIGEATKLVPYLLAEDKEYLATIRFGVTTDTEDLTGTVLSTRAVPALDRDTLTAATRPFVGRIHQVPPMFSALHHEGRRLYELAREGIEVARTPREVVVHDIVVESVVGPSATLRIVCGRGTYVRTLAADLGAALGCGAALEQLIRTRVGPFHRIGAPNADTIASATLDDLWTKVLPPERALVGWHAVELNVASAAAFVHGQTVDVGPAGDRSERLVRVHEQAGRLLGVGQMTADGHRVKPLRILHADRSRSPVLPA
jgi:tRNA pseudouridine55 synthase